MVKVVLSTISDGARAREIASTLVGERLVACVNIVDGVTSIYRWQNEVQHDAELLMIMKTEASRVDALLARLGELHPYDVPEMLVLDAPHGSGAYLDWVRSSTTQV